MPAVVVVAWISKCSVLKYVTYSEASLGELDIGSNLRIRLEEKWSNQMRAHLNYMQAIHAYI